jgi:hypothetical protein
MHNMHTDGTKKPQETGVGDLGEIQAEGEDRPSRSFVKNERTH